MAIASCLVDTNILLRITRRVDPQLNLVDTALARLASQNTTLYFTHQNIAELWNAMTRPVDRNGLGMSIPDTERIVRAVEEGMVFLPDNQAVYREWRNLVLNHAVSGVQVSDARLAAAIRVHAVSHILTLNGSVDILATPMKIGDIRPFKTVVCYRGRRCDGRSRTPALRSDRPSSLPSGASALPQPFQQTPVQPTAVAGDPLPDALRGLDLSRGRGAARRTSRIAAGARTDQRARFHYVVSLLAASGRPDNRPRGGRDRTPVAWSAQKRAVARSRGGRRDRLGARCSQHVFCASPAPSRAKAAAVAALAQVAGRGRSGSAIRVVADRAPRSVERLCQSARCGRNRRAANSHRPGLGRCRVRQRKESYLHPSATRGTKRDPRQAWKENLASTWCPCGDAPGVSVSTLPATRSDRERILLGQTQALGARPWAKPVYASAPSSAARPEFQFVPPESSLPFSEDVNRAQSSLVAPTRAGKVPDAA